jgi:6-phosphogluconolactonase
MPPAAEIRVLNTPQELFQTAATEFISLAEHFVQANGRFTVALSGGSTPRALYSLLASEVVPHIAWEKIFFFFGDERPVPPDDPESNYRMANESLLSRVSIPPDHVFRIPAEEGAASAAQSYEETLRGFFQLKPEEFPRFDLIFLGLGPDGHTASLFPGSAALAEEKRLVVDNWVEKFKTARITFTYPVINNASNVILLVSGGDKAPAVRQVLQEAADLPAHRIQPRDGRLLWVLDRAAASALSLTQ